MGAAEYVRGGSDGPGSHQRCIGVDGVANEQRSEARVLGSKGREKALAHRVLERRERAAVTLQPQASVDRLRSLATVEWTPTAATLIASGAEGATLRELAFARGAVVNAAQALGLAERMVRIAVDYASTRQQFGRAIGSYQALKHHMADVQVQLEYARPVVYAAAARLAEVAAGVSGGDVTSSAVGEAGANGKAATSALLARLNAVVSGAKLMAMEAADMAGRKGIQLHGAMGYSWEVDLHFYVKRAWALAGSWGDRCWHQRRLESLVLEESVVEAVL